MMVAQHLSLRIGSSLHDLLLAPLSRSLTRVQIRPPCGRLKKDGNDCVQGAHVWGERGGTHGQHCRRYSCCCCRSSSSHCMLVEERERGIWREWGSSSVKDCVGESVSQSTVYPAGCCDFFQVMVCTTVLSSLSLTKSFFSKTSSQCVVVSARIRTSAQQHRCTRVVEENTACPRSLHALASRGGRVDQPKRQSEHQYHCHSGRERD